jgi:DNA polymerase III sliding clamp (beta) subunit (PCNA family)
MEMLQVLKFVQGAVAKKDFIPAMKHFAIENGRVRAYNGSLALSSPIAFNIDCNPKAVPLVQAITNCPDTQVTLTMTPAGRLKIRSGAFNAFIECEEGQVPPALPEGEEVRNFDGEQMLAALKALAPFIGDDASRQWSNGVLLRDQSAFVTNNVILVEYWIGSAFPKTVNLPKTAVREMLRVNEPPEYAQTDGQSMTFHYSDGRWIRTQLLATEWPDVNKILELPSNPVPIDNRLFTALDLLKPFADKMGRVFMKDGVLSTAPADMEGAKYDFPEFTTTCAFQIDMLGLLNGFAQQIDFSTYPRPCQFFGDRVRGSIIGVLMK